METMKCVIAGTGPIGLSIMEELHRQSVSVIMVNRSGNAPEIIPDDIQIKACDIQDAAALATICDGCDFLIHAAGVPRTDWIEKLPPIMDGIIGAAEKTGTTVLYLDNLSAYGDNHGIPISEATPERPQNAFEQVRSDLVRSLRTAGKQGRVKFCIARCTDLYGPRIKRQPLGLAVFGEIAASRPASMIGRLDMPHSYMYIKDMAKMIYLLMTHEESSGQLWHLPCPAPITQQQILDILRDVTNSRVKATTINSSGLGWKSMMKPELKELKDILYQFENPYILNFSRYATTFGERTTTHAQALFETLEWFRRQAGFQKRFGI